MDEQQANIRALRESDLSEWLRLRKLLWDETSEDDHQAEMVDIFEHPETQGVGVADKGNGSLIGFVEVSIRPFVEDCETDHVGYLEGWFVEDSFRRKGVGKELVRFAEAWARERGCTEIASDAEIGNELSLAAHTKLGYSETSRLVHLRKELA
ncbi:aminoglycoside 6'-N-acetyltransferase [Leptolyngbya sp. 7M]|uniref:aminoglycoside 6'-N-acetyltransferase n=1 Tax=Leptolyngbya sp. 7M TaxID=2812896 RepID=UPI001B8BFAFE|nr:aminoglycoside 6'-N-acetyltransferase [Leptolyngbya sp. 7M]QYO62425.1 GNAT family N-acetyltransferase [Leptolyngbya sp. 7M]